MRQIPIIMQDFSVNAILREIVEAGTGKSMTRRLAWDAKKHVSFAELDDDTRREYEGAGWRVENRADDRYHCNFPTRWQKVKPGDLLWVKEPWRVDAKHDSYKINQLAERRAFQTVWFDGGYLHCDLTKRRVSDLHPADLDCVNREGRTRNPMYLPKDRSRITLEVTAVKVEPLHNITCQEAEKEGVEWESADPPFYYLSGIYPHSITAVGVEMSRTPAKDCFAKLWNYLHGSGAWDANPEVVAVSFRPILANINTIASKAA